jgi:hypothetical protein
MYAVLLVYAVWILMNFFSSLSYNSSGEGISIHTHNLERTSNTYEP